jgi:hypothetical protein
MLPTGPDSDGLRATRPPSRLWDAAQTIAIAVLGALKSLLRF